MAPSKKQNIKQNKTKQAPTKYPTKNTNEKQQKTKQNKPEDIKQD